MSDHKETKSKHQNYENFRENDGKEKLRMKQYADPASTAKSTATATTTTSLPTKTATPAEQIVGLHRELETRCRPRTKT